MSSSEPQHRGPSLSSPETQTTVDEKRPARRRPRTPEGGWEFKHVYPWERKGTGPETYQNVATSVPLLSSPSFMPQSPVLKPEQFFLGAPKLPPTELDFEVDVERTVSKAGSMPWEGDVTVVEVPGPRVPVVVLFCY